MLWWATPSLAMAAWRDQIETARQLAEMFAISESRVRAMYWQ